MDHDYALNWLDQTKQSIERLHRPAAGCANHLSQRLARLLLERLPAELSQVLISLLSPSQQVLFEVSASEASIGYLDFIDHAAFTLGCAGCIATPSDTEAFAMELDELAKKITDTFLWTLAGDFSADLKARLAAALPWELRCRLNLYREAQGKVRAA